MLLSVLGLGLSTASVGFISAVHLLAALGLLLALLVADFCWTEQPRRWRSEAVNEPPPPGERAGAVRPRLPRQRALAEGRV